MTLSRRAKVSGSTRTTKVTACERRGLPSRPLETLDPSLPYLDHPDLGLLTGSTADHDQDATLDELVERLDRAAEQLRSGDLSADAAATVVEDCAAIASQASAELERRAREAGRDPLPGQDSLL